MPRSPLLRPTLVPGLRRAWRTLHTLQLGYDPARAVLLDLPDPRAAELLDLLDGSRTERTVLAAAEDTGVAVGDARELLDTLHAAGLLLPTPSLLPPLLTEDARRRLIGEAADLALTRAIELRNRTDAQKACNPAQTLRRRAAARVVVAGRGRLGSGIAVALAEAGVRNVHPDLIGVVTGADLPGSPLRAGDLGRPYADAVAAAVEVAVPGTVTQAVRKPGPDLIIQLDHDQPVALQAAAHARRRRPHLAVTLREGTAIVGPLVPATGGPCLNCVDLVRRDRDDGWPELSAPAAGPEPGSVATVLTAIAYATAEALAFLDGRLPDTLGASVEIFAPGRVRRRTWRPHPGCGCTPGRAMTDPTGLFVRHPANQADSGG